MRCHLLILFLAFTFFFSTQAFAVIEMPSQFKSDKAAVVLGLDNHTKITVADVSKAARKLLAKYHPERHIGNENYSAEDRVVLTEITRKVLEAQNALRDYLKINPDFNPQAHSQAPQSSSHPGAGSDSGHEKPYSWDTFVNDLHREAERFARRQEAERARRTPGRSVVGADYYGDGSFHGTMFDFMELVPSLQTVVLTLEGRSPNLSENYDLLLVIDRRTFPHIEVRVLRRDLSGLGGKAPALIENYHAKYIRGGHAGAGETLFDTIEFPNGNYLLEPSDLVKPYRVNFEIERLKAAPEVGVLKANGIQLYIEFAYKHEYDGYFANEMSFLASEAPTQYMPIHLPAPAKPAWLSLELPKNEGSVIYLGYERPICQHIFGRSK